LNSRPNESESVVKAWRAASRYRSRCVRVRLEARSRARGCARALSSASVCFRFKLTVFVIYGFPSGDKDETPSSSLHSSLALVTKSQRAERISQRKEDGEKERERKRERETREPCRAMRKPMISSYYSTRRHPRNVDVSRRPIGR